VSLLYGLILALRNSIPASRYKAKIPVISIGNIVAGGTGKTPFTIMLARSLEDVAILTRGYKSKLENSAGTLIDAHSSSDTVGDEALLLARHLPNAKVYVGKKRVEAAKKVESTSLRVIILDDGFQHRALARDLDIVLIDCQNPFGGSHLLPLGMLREPLNNLKRADLIVLNRVERAHDVQAIKDAVRTYTQAPIIQTKMIYQGVKTLMGEPITLPPHKVGLFCGLGNPQQFKDFVEAQGFQVVATKFLGDHEAMSEQALQDLYRQVGVPLLCTEKDGVKLKPSKIPVYTVSAELQVTAGKNHLENMIQRLFATN